MSYYTAYYDIVVNKNLKRKKFLINIFNVRE